MMMIAEMIATNASRMSRIIFKYLFMTVKFIYYSNWVGGLSFSKNWLGKFIGYSTLSLIFKNITPLKNFLHKFFFHIIPFYNMLKEKEPKRKTKYDTLLG
jgi:hypothetical protein